LEILANYGLHISEEMAEMAPSPCKKDIFIMA